MIYKSGHDKNLFLKESFVFEFISKIQQLKAVQEMTFSRCAYLTILPQHLTEPVQR